MLGGLFAKRKGGVLAVCLALCRSLALLNSGLHTIQLERQVMTADTSKDHETYLALGNAIMLPHDLANLPIKDSEGFRDRLVMIGAWVCCSARSVLSLLPLNTQ